MLRLKPILKNHMLRENIEREVIWVMGGLLNVISYP